VGNEKILVNQPHTRHLRHDRSDICLSGWGPRSSMDDILDPWLTIRVATGIRVLQP